MLYPPEGSWSNEPGGCLSFHVNGKGKIGQVEPSPVGGWAAFDRSKYPKVLIEHKLWDTKEEAMQAVLDNFTVIG